jgi:WD40 repeat protein
LAAGRGSGRAVLWPLVDYKATGTPISLPVREGPVTSIAFSGDGRWLVTASKERTEHTAYVWDLADPAAAPVVLGNTAGRTFAVTISPDSHWLATVNWETGIELWNLAGAQSGAQAIMQADLGARDAFFSLDSRWLATLGSQGIHLWTLAEDDAVSDSMQLVDQAASALVFAPDPRQLVAGLHDGNVLLWELALGQPTATPTHLTQVEQPVLGLAIGPADQRLAIGDGKGVTWLTLDPTTSLSRDPLSLGAEGHTGRPLAISGGDRWLLTVGSERTGSYPSLQENDKGDVYLWNLRLDPLIKLACQTVRRNLDRSEWDRYFPGEPYRKTCPDLPNHPSVTHEQETGTQ